jgi:zinc/manganese transport system substrate-binding protein
MSKLLTFLLYFVLAVFVNLANAKTINIVTSFTVLQDIVQNISGNKAKINNLVGYDQDPHEFELKPKDMILLNNADIVVVNGLGLESWVNKIDKSKLVLVNDGINPLIFDGKIDPHTWQDPCLVSSLYVRKILVKLQQIDPDNAAYYQANADRYTEKLRKLNNEIIRQFAKIPQNVRYVVTTHDAFSYFAKRYNLKFLSLQGVSTDSEPSAQDMAKIEHHISLSPTKIVFLENMSNSKLMKQIASDTGAIIGGKLYADGLSHDIVANTYIKMIEANIMTILKVYKKFDKNIKIEC